MALQPDGCLFQGVANDRDRASGAAGFQVQPSGVRAAVEAGDVVDAQANVDPGALAAVRARKVVQLDPNTLGVGRAGRAGPVVLVDPFQVGANAGDCGGGEFDVTERGHLCLLGFGVSQESSNTYIIPPGPA